MQQYDRYPYNDDYNGNSVFDRQSSSSDGYSLGVFFTCFSFSTISLVVGYLMETYPVVAWIVCFGGVALNVYVFYKIIKFYCSPIRKLFEVRNQLKNNREKKAIRASIASS